MKVRVFFFSSSILFFFAEPSPSFPNPYNLYKREGETILSELVWTRPLTLSLLSIRLYSTIIRGGRRKKYTRDEKKFHHRDIDPWSSNPLNFSPFSKIAFRPKAWKLTASWKLFSMEKTSFNNRCHLQIYTSFSFPERSCEKYRFTFHPCSINYFRDPCNNVAFLLSLGQFLAGNVPRI